jgi:xanthine/uracil permease
VVQTLLFVTGINTLLQTLFGTRLPTVVGGSFAFLVPIVSIIHDSSLTRIVDDHQVRFNFSLISFFVWRFSGIYIIPTVPLP